jgi:hypothetical protein
VSVVLCSVVLCYVVLCCVIYVVCCDDGYRIMLGVVWCGVVWCGVCSVMFMLEKKLMFLFCLVVNIVMVKVPRYTMNCIVGILKRMNGKW